VVGVSGAAGTAAVAVVGGGGVFFEPAHGGLPFSTRRACFAASPFQTLVCGELHRPLFAWVIVGGLTVGGLTVGVVTGVVTGWVTGVGTVTTGGGDGAGRCVGPDGCVPGRVTSCRGVTTATADGVGRGTSIGAVACGRERCGAGMTSDGTGPRSAGAVPGKSPAGGGWRTSKERATDPVTAAPAGTNDPIAAIFRFIPSPARGRQPSLGRSPLYRR
jgi:hypothetical protein